VVHTEKDSGPQRTLLPRLEMLRDAGVRIATLVPAPGPAAELAGTVGDVLFGGPEALVIPRRPGCSQPRPQSRRRSRDRQLGDAPGRARGRQ